MPEYIYLTWGLSGSFDVGFQIRCWTVTFESNIKRTTKTSNFFSKFLKDFGLIFKNLFLAVLKIGNFELIDKKFKLIKYLNW